MFVSSHGLGEASISGPALQQLLCAAHPVSKEPVVRKRRSHSTYGYDMSMLGFTFGFCDGLYRLHIKVYTGFTFGLYDVLYRLHIKVYTGFTFGFYDGLYWLHVVFDRDRRVLQPYPLFLGRQVRPKE